MIFLTGCISFGQKEETVGPGASLGAFVSPDKAETWLEKNDLMTPGDKALSIAKVSMLNIYTDPTDTDSLYLASRSNGLFYTYNGGEGWTQATSLLEQKSGRVFAVAVDPEDKCSIYTGVEDEIYKSSDCNRTWQRVFKAQKTEHVMRSIVVDWYNSDIVYATARDGSIYKSTDNGMSWVKKTDLRRDVRELVMDNKDSRILYLSTRVNGLYRSTDAGETWVNLSDNMKQFTKGGIQDGYGVEVAMDKTGTIFYLSKFGLIKSTDRGETWEQIKLLTGENEVEFYAFDIDPNNSDYIYFADAKTLYRSLNGGQTWETKALPSTNLIAGLQVHEKDGNLIYTVFKTLEE